MIGKQVEERIELDRDTRIRILKKTKFCCAACGAKLDIVKHTVDHIIPISRGGTNEIDNLVGLCKVCNEYKDNLLYYPGDYYTYLTVTNPKLMEDLHMRVVEYLKGEVKKLNIHRYPLISPCCTSLSRVNGIAPKSYMRQMLFDIVYMRSDMRRANSGKVNFLKDYPYYGVIKRSTQNLIAILRIDYNVGVYFYDNGDDIAQLTVYNEWQNCNLKTLGPMMRNIAEVLSARYVELGIPLSQICIASRDEKIPVSIYDYCVVNGFGWFNKPVYVSVLTGTLHDRDELGEIPYCCVDFKYKDIGVLKHENKE